jgi:rRNA-processing protein FCF1
MFFKYNTALGPPYRILIDTNFINFSIQNKLDILKNSMDCLLGKVTPVVTECVVAELEKLGSRYRMALKLTKDPRFQIVKCDHQVNFHKFPNFPSYGKIPKFPNPLITSNPKREHMQTTAW